jgi:hypothetical protein
MFKRGWESGQARIVGRQTSEHMYRSGLNWYAPTGQYHWVYDYVADVEPDSGAPAFRAEFTELFNDDEDHIRRPNVGDQARVKFDPKSREVEFDRAMLRADAKSASEAKKQSFDALARAAPSPPPEPTPLEEISATVGRLSAAAGDLSETMAAIQRAKASGDFAELERLRLEFQARAQQNATAAHDAAAGRSAPAAVGDPLQRLQNLADLHDRGALTDAEFTAAKAKLLGEN